MTNINARLRQSLLIGSLCVALNGCAGSSPFEVIQGIFGYIPPPEDTTIAQELQSEYERCMKIGKDKNCAQVAYDMVRTVKGLEPRTVPEGVVIILRGDGGHAKSEEVIE